MKKVIYILSFVVLGIVLQQVVHTIVEVWYIARLTNDFGRYGFGLSWRVWFIIHHLYGIVLFLAGAWWGYRQGRRWWPKLYDLRGRVRYPRPWRI